MVDKLVKKANASILVGSRSWKDQFMEAFQVEAGGEWSTINFCYTVVAPQSHKVTP